MKFSSRLRLHWHEFKISQKSLVALKRAGVTNIGFHNGTRGKKYAYAGIGTNKKLLHRFLMQLIGHDICGLEVDHKNGNGLDNYLRNLRIATRAQNCGNANKPATNNSGFKGVYFNKQNKNWVANIGRPTKYLGSFTTPEDAARAYNAAAKKRYGKFAKLNACN